MAAQSTLAALAAIAKALEDVQKLLLEIRDNTKPKK
jgi:hypothetical protein